MAISNNPLMSIHGIDEGEAYGSKRMMYEFPVYLCQMTDRIQATLYGVKDGVTYKGQTVTLSVEQATLSIMPQMDATLQTMAANMLYYGAMLQKNFGYRLDHLADDELGSYADLVNREVPAASDGFSSTSTGKTGATVLRRALGIGASVQLQYQIKLTGYSAQELNIELNIAGETIVYDGAELITSKSSCFLIFDDLLPTEADETFTFRVLTKDGTVISETYTDSLAYLAATYQNPANETLYNAVNALLNYYRSAFEAYNG